MRESNPVTAPPIAEPPVTLPQVTPPPVILPPGHGWRRLPRIGLAAGFGALGLAVLSVVAGVVDLERALTSYLVAFLYVTTIGLGALFFVLVQWLTRAGWSVVVRRLAESVAGTLPLLLLLFLPIGFGLGAIYEWARPEVLDGLASTKARYFDPDAFRLRALVCLLAWALLGGLYRHGSLRLDAAHPATAWARRLRGLSAPALLLFGFTTTFAAFDWVMSLEVHWFSTIFGVYLFAGAVVASLALLVLLTTRLERDGVLAGDTPAAQRQRYLLGLLLFGFVAFWAYVAFSQFMLIWYANLPEETFWYAERWESGWRLLSLTLVGGHFVLPFLWLLPRAAKTDPARLWPAAIGLLVMHYLDLYWLVVPAAHLGGPAALLVDALTLVGVTSLAGGAVLALLARGSLLPTGDPRLGEAVDSVPPVGAL